MSHKGPGPSSNVKVHAGLAFQKGTGGHRRKSESPYWVLAEINLPKWTGEDPRVLVDAERAGA